MNVIEVKNLSYIYGKGMPDEKTALDNISFSVEQGEFLGIIGPTGCGKSTLVSHFNAINKPTIGEVFIDGRNIWHKKESLKELRFKVGLVFQYPENQLFEETVFADIAFGPKNMGLSKETIKERVEQAAELCGISQQLLQKSPFELSGGQKRRAAIAGVVAMKPKILVLDEPAAGLDPKGREQILSSIKDIHDKTGSTIVLVSHSMEDIAKYSSKVMVLKQGKIEMLDSVEQVFSRAEELEQMGLDVPEITKIFLHLKDMGVDIATDVYTLKYAEKQLIKR